MFFDKFPTIRYEINNNSVKMVDIFRNVDVKDVLADDVIAYEYVDIINGERPDILSQRIYGTPEYYWTFFIVNDELKDILHDWPLSNLEFEEQMAIKYDSYASILLKPYITTATHYLVSDDSGESKALPEGTAWMTNNIGGLDLTYTYLRASRNGATAKIKEWDPAMLLLTFEEFSDRDVFLAEAPEGESYPITLTLDPKYIRDREWFEWVRSLCAWRSALVVDDIAYNEKDLPINVFKNIESLYFADTTQMYDAVYNTFENPAGGYFSNLDLISFNPLVIYDNLRYGPNYYTDYSGRAISAFVATDGPTVEESIPKYFISNYEYEEALNEQKSRIKVIKPQYIEEFADEYKELLNR